jgi:hypothetical protein
MTKCRRERDANSVAFQTIGSDEKSRQQGEQQKQQRQQRDGGRSWASELRR